MALSKNQRLKQLSIFRFNFVKGDLVEVIVDYFPVITWILIGVQMAGLVIRLLVSYNALKRT